MREVSRGRPKAVDVNPRAAAALGVYAVVVSLVLTSFYEPLTQGRDDSWAIAVAVCCVHLGVAVAIGRIWVVLLPIGFSLAAFFVDGAEALAWLILVFAMPVLLVVTLIGWGAARLLDGRLVAAITAVAFAVAAAPTAWAALEQVRRDDPLPRRAQAMLPLEVSLGNLCSGAERLPQLDQGIGRRAAALLRELERHPHHVVAYTPYRAEDPEAAKEQITVRELAEEQLRDLETGGAHCVGELQRRLRDALD